MENAKSIKVDEPYISRCKCIQISSSEISKHFANRMRHFHCSLYTVRWLETSENRFEERINIFLCKVECKKACGGWLYWSSKRRCWDGGYAGKKWNLWRMIAKGVLNIISCLFTFIHGYCIHSFQFYDIYISRYKTFTQKICLVFTLHIVHFQ